MSPANSIEIPADDLVLAAGEASGATRRHEVLDLAHAVRREEARQEDVRVRPVELLADDPIFERYAAARRWTRPCAPEAISRAELRSHTDLGAAALGLHHRSSASRPAEAGTAGLTATRMPLSTQPRWLGEKRGAKRPSLSSRVTAKRSKTVGGK